MTWEKLYPISFTVENKTGNLHEITLFIFISNFTYILYTFNLRIYQRIGKNRFSTEKN